MKNLQSSWFLSSYTRNICITLYFSRFGAKSLKWLVMGASTLIVCFTSQWRLSCSIDGHNWSFIQVGDTSNNSLAFSIHPYDILSITCSLHPRVDRLWLITSTWRPWGDHSMSSWTPCADKVCLPLYYMP